MTQHVREWLKEYVATEKEKLGEAETKIRLDAMDAMFNGWRSMNSDQFKEAMTIAHFATYFSDALSRAFYADYQMKSGAWRDYTYPDTAPDFRAIRRGRMSEPGTLLSRREKAEAKATYIDDTWINLYVDEFARQFDVSWQAILNDDLGKIKETPMRMARAAARFEDAFVSNLYDNATTQATLAGIGAPYAGTGRLTAANLAIAIAAFATRVDLLGNPLNITGMWLVIPPILEVQARTILESTLMAGVATNDKNVLPSFIRGYRVDPYIATAAPNIPWYMFADPGDIPAVPVVRLQGVPGPFSYKKASNIEMISGTAPAGFLLGDFATGDIEYAVEDFIGGYSHASFGGVADIQGLYYSSGTTP